MTNTTPGRSCPHCGAELRSVVLPENGGWENCVHLACFNDDCGYFQRGWGWMSEQYGVRASYRYRVDPVSGAESPLPVWSPSALRDRILTEAAAPCA